LEGVRAGQNRLRYLRKRDPMTGRFLKSDESFRQAIKKEKFELKCKRLREIAIERERKKKLKELTWSGEVGDC